MSDKGAPSSREMDELDRLSDEYTEAVDARGDDEGILHLKSDDELTEFGLSILNRYRAIYQEFPDSEDVAISISLHLYRISEMYWDVIDEPTFTEASPPGQIGNAEAAQLACVYNMESYEASPRVTAAMMFGDLFAMAGFFATAMYWSGEAQRLARENDADDEQMEQMLAYEKKIQVESIRHNLLQVHGPDPLKVDPALNPKALFPTSSTPGLQLGLQPSASNQSTGKTADSAPTDAAKRSPDIEALNELSDRIERRGKQEPRTQMTNTIVLIDEDELVEDGKKLLKLYNQELAAYPDDPRVAAGLQNFLIRLADIMTAYLHPLDSWQDRPPSAQYSKPLAATEACMYLMQAYDIRPTARIAAGFSQVFSIAKYYGTSLHWLDEAITIAEAEGKPQFVTALKAIRLEMKADDKTEDPVLDPELGFPKTHTPGLQLRLQPATPVKPTSAASPLDIPRDSGTPSPSNTALPAKSGPCFVATACYGSDLHPDVMFLRAWRDRVLLPRRHGRLFVALYYRISPPLANWLAGHPRWAALVRTRCLETVVRKLRL